MWTITSYFNPLGYKLRRDNYSAFRKNLGGPLITVELSSNGRFELTDADADILVRVSDNGPRSVLFQKERLLNIALKHVPKGEENVAWIDCDIVMNPGWMAQTEKILEQYTLCQLFAEIIHLPQGKMPPDTMFEPRHEVWRSFIYNASLPPERQSRVRHTGMAWAGKKTVLDKIGFYDAMVLGGGPLALVTAIYQQTDFIAAWARMNPEWKAHYLAWANNVRREVNGRIGYSDVRLYHLWHGNYADRDYHGIYEKFAPFNFNPSTDLVDGEWASDRADLHEFAYKYFASRKEDSRGDAKNHKNIHAGKTSMTQVGDGVLFSGYQKFLLRKGSIAVTPEDSKLLNKYETLRPIFPSLVTGKTVLDLGANGGFFSFWAKLNGARDIIALDIDGENVEAVKGAAALLDFSGIRAIKESVFSCREHADVVIALSVIHWLSASRIPRYDSFEGLEKMMESLAGMTKDVLIVEWIAADDPTFALLEETDKKKYSKESFEAALRRHFSSFEILPAPSGNFPARQVYIARKLQGKS